ncbi:NAD(P)-dependent alcohol dehydrogenase [Sphingomonas profundi]|uniref:NAD(P)-dependent alcohol dehydrogenase n=1 Tax=Alterirhizorhabdus profundi TaxID=2681549 RepID=UPI0012E8D825|nr:NAD(P)-dependent alcohol dehydrogenase [Sphingomonas profundi]
MTARTITVAAMRGAGAAFSIEPATLAEPGPHEVLVRIAGVGICHTDLVARDQLAPFPLPAVLGHEGAGIVEAVGSAIGHVAPGDHVVLSFDSCSTCDNCRRDKPAYCREFYQRNFTGARAGGAAIHDGAGCALHGRFFGQSSFASHALAAERSVVKIADEVPVELMGPLGCGIQTGAGAVLNALMPPPGSSIAIFGAGAVGLSALLAAVIAGCTTMVVIDRSGERLALARELGATHIVDATAGDTVAAIQAITGGGADFTLECTGVPAVLRQAVDALTVPGTCGVLGVAPCGAEVSLDITGLLSGRTVRGIIEGDSVPQVFIPRLVDLWRAGRFPFDRLITRYPLADIDRAIAESHAGGVLKAVLCPA